jgi:hypothetical protein
MSDFWIEPRAQDQPGAAGHNSCRNWQGGQETHWQPGQDGPPPIVNYIAANIENPPVVNNQESVIAPVQANGKPPQIEANAKMPPHGYADDWHTVRFSNTTAEPITVEITVAAGQALPTGAGITPNAIDPNKAIVRIEPGQHVDVTFASATSANFRSTKGDGSVWNQGEVFFDETNKVIWGNMSYIYGANSNMRIFSMDGQHSGHLGDIVANAPAESRVGTWGIQAPYDRFNPSDDPGNPDSATGGPAGPLNSGSAYLYSVLHKGEGYVHRGRPAEVTDYDDASSLRFSRPLAVVF